MNSNPPSPSQSADASSKNIRKPYTITNSRESWTEEEHDKFLEALQLYGDGEPTDNATRFYKWFMEGKDRGEWLKSLQYGVFGLGNKQYEHFNKIAVDVDDLLAEQGGKRLVKVGMEDDDQCIDDDFAAWRELMWPELDKLLRNEDDASLATPYTAAVLEYRVTFYEQTDVLITENSFANCHANGNTAYDAQHPCRANVAIKIEGAFVQGLGFFMLEECPTNSDGLMLANGTWTYKVPTLDTIPKQFNVEVVNS